MISIEQAETVAPAPDCAPTTLPTTLHPALDPSVWSLAEAETTLADEAAWAVREDERDETVRQLCVQVWEMGEQLRAQNDLLVRLIGILGGGQPTG